MSAGDVPLEPLADGELVRRFPSIPWGRCVTISVPDVDRAGRLRGFYVCRLCVARVGVKAQALLAGDVDFAFDDAAGWEAHMRAEHDDVLVPEPLS